MVDINSPINHASAEEAQLVALNEEETFANSFVAPRNISYVSSSNSSSVEEYDRLVQDLIFTSDNGGNREHSCKECPYSRKNRAHVMEHVGIHIRGFQLPCNSCGKTFGSRVSLRKHYSKCISEFFNTSNNYSM